MTATPDRPPCRRQALQQTRSHPRRVPRVRRATSAPTISSISSAAKTRASAARRSTARCSGWSSAGIARKVDFGEGRSRFEPSYRHPRHFHLICNDLPSLVRVSELGRRSARSKRSPRRGASRRRRRSCRSTARATSAGPAQGHAADRRRDDRAACSRATRCGWRSRPSAAASSSTRAPLRLTSDARGRAVFQKLAEEEQRAPRHAREALPRAHRDRSAARIAADVPVLQGRGERPVRGGRRSSCARASTTSRRCSSASGASAARTSSSSDTASASRTRKASRSSSSSPTKSARTSIC